MKIDRSEVVVVLLPLLIWYIDIDRSIGGCNVAAATAVVLSP